MQPIVQCVPNISEGRNRGDRRGGGGRCTGNTQCQVAGLVSSDADHNRSVITFVGTPTAWKRRPLPSAPRPQNSST